MKKTGLLRAAICLTGIPLMLLAACSTTTLSRDASLPFADNARYIGSTSCLECHEEATRDVAMTVHGRLATFEYAANAVQDSLCESCHGPGSVHVDSMDPADIVNPATQPAAQASAICQQCHTDGALMNWGGSTHDINGLACTECHSGHGLQDAGASRDRLGYEHKLSKKALLKVSEPELCYTCHASVRAQNNMPNHHPVKEGKMSCSDCHNAHGSQTRPLLNTDERKNELCLQCHTEKSGPFAFEHAPVVEDCTICHAPHGAISDNLLHQNEPFLCLQCHELHFHTNFRANDTMDGVNSAGIPDEHSMQKAMMTRCSQCHSKVHGSDLPSLYTTGGGSRLTR